LNTNLENITSNTGLINFCGCYIPGTDYTDVKQQCQPLCHRVSNVKLPDGNGGLLSCLDNVCVIDNVSITAAKTDGRSTDVSFTQVCRCPAGQCKCILSNTNLYGLVGNVSFDQVCGAGSACYVVNENPNAPPVQVRCPEVILPPENSIYTNNNLSYWIPWLIMIIVVFCIFLFLAI